MKKLIYEDINLETKCSYSIYRVGYSRSDFRYFVYETDPDGNQVFIGDFTEAKALELVREKCK